MKIPFGLDLGKDGGGVLEFTYDLLEDDIHQPYFESNIGATDPNGREGGHNADHSERCSIDRREAEAKDAGVGRDIGFIMPIMVLFGKDEAHTSMEGEAKVLIGGWDRGGAND